MIYAQDYFDYTGWLEKMDYDMKNDFNLFPKNFKKAHDEMSKQYIKFKDKNQCDMVGLLKGRISITEIAV